MTNSCLQLGLLLELMVAGSKSKITILYINLVLCVTDIFVGCVLLHLLEMDGLYECAVMTHLLQFSLKTQDINLTHFKLGLESRDVNGVGPG